MPPQRHTARPLPPSARSLFSTMQMTDIVNRDVASLSTCASEPIHIPGAIQPHGVLFSLDAQGIVRYCSANCALFFGKGPEALLQEPIATLDHELEAWLKPALNDGAETGRPLHLERQGSHWAVFGCVNADGHFVVECERASADFEEPEHLFDQTTRLVQHIERARNLQELCQRIAEQTRALTGYDRVMIYRFDEHYNGQVYAESKAAGLEPFLDLHYPHTDIPPQARELYLRNLIRMIPDVRYEPVALLTVAGSEAPQPLDLSDARLRSVSPLHLQYLQNMGVAATLTISILLEGKLWGLIACHHLTPKHINHLQRKAALLQGHFLSSQVKVREVAEEYAVHTVVEAHLQQLLSTLNTEGDFGLRFQKLTSLLGVAGATGAAVLHQGSIYTSGSTPNNDRTRALFNWLAARPGLSFVTDHLPEFYPEGARIAGEAAGILYHKLGDGKKDAIIWFRQEQERNINWAGNPYDAVKRATLANQLSPRSSFALYREEVRGYSSSWRPSEVESAGRFAFALQNQFHLAYLRAEEASQRVLNEQLMKANQELANINWITTHDLKEPIRKIMVFASRLVNQEELALPENLLHAVDRIQQSAQRMGQLVEDLMAYRLVDSHEKKVEPVDLNDIIRELVEEYDDELSEQSARVLADQLPKVHMIRFQARQLFANLLGNSLKFSDRSRPLEIHIRCAQVFAGSFQHPTKKNTGDFYRIEFRDNGIGFTPDHNKRIFDIFYRLHTASDYKGTGIGLAICKRIVENHGGFLEANGVPGEGASFTLYLPKEDVQA
ncbi:MAG: GAF domain-containing protein [Chitinophagaceae bacterium]|nr:MAG: GAF domain-containing protein [Chitinophagaceae bacterium]